VLWSVTGLLLLAGSATIALDGLRWRAHLVALKTAGKIPDLGWVEMAKMLDPRGQFHLEPLLTTRNPHRSIANPATSETDVALGREAFRNRCASCHGSDGAGGTAPALVGKPLPRGGSDWALYRTISRGIPGTGMAAQKIPERARWQIVGFIQARRGSLAPTASGEAERVSVPSISARALVEARSDSANWLTYSGAYDGWRYSTLAQITRANVHRLRLLWMYQVPAERETRFESSAIALDGILFITTPQNGVRALDAETGVLLWSYERELPVRLSLCCGRSNRGLAILGNTLYLATLDAHLVALDAKSGNIRWDIAVADPAIGYSFTSAPLAVKDLVVIGSAGGEYATRGFIDAYDATTGKRQWRFHTIPAAGEAGSETWSGDSWRSGGGPAWLTGSYDPALDLIYWGTGNPNPDYDGATRMGDNLYTNSVVALEANTGRLRWHFQFTPHDEHDWDAAQIPVLVNAPEGSPRPLMLWANRNGFYYVLDRATGRFLRGRPFAEQTWADGLDSTGRPLVRPETSPSVGGTHVLPGSHGATNWWSPSFSPRTGIIYVPTFNRRDLFFKGNSPEDPGLPRLGGGRETILPNSGRLSISALDALTGERRWEHQVFGAYPEFFERVGGLLSTAGDVVFGGGHDLLVALDALDGRRLWTFRTGQAVHAAPITYLVRGRQRYTVAAGGALLTFGLDEPGPVAPSP
jgi:alcohol dehydrogenase (cytochrome c)